MKDGFCKDCKHWIDERSCRLIESEFGGGSGKNWFSLSVHVEDGYGLDVQVTTGPLFGCRLFEE